MDRPSVSVSATRTINLGNYENTSKFVSISGVTPDMTRADILELLECGNEAYDLICEEIDRRVELVKTAEARVFNLFNTQTVLSVDAQKYLDLNTISSPPYFAPYKQVNPLFNTPNGYATPRRLVLAASFNF